MNQQWEDKFRSWAQSPSQAETQRLENAERAIREAIQGSQKLKQRNIKVFTQGSYRNRTNVRRDSDIDVGVLCYDTFFYDMPEGKTRESFGIDPATYSYGQFKDEIGEALVGYFGVSAVNRGNKAFDIKEGRSQVEADVAPFFEHRRYDATERYFSGVELRADDGARIINWPEQHYANGNEKNKGTSRRYRALVRVLKSLRNEMEEKGVSAARPIIGFLSECLIWNVPDGSFGRTTYYEDLRSALVHLWEPTKTDGGCQQWGEVSELKYLFRPHQKWTRQQANDFILAAWQYVGFQ